MMSSRDQLAVAPVPVRIVGHGPVKIIVSHGWIADSTLFDLFIEEIDFNQFTYAFMDARGYGSRLQDRGPWTIETVADDILLVADQLEWKQFHILGHSMGGMVAQWLMVQALERIASAVLLAPVPASGAKLDAARRTLLLQAIAEPESRRALIDANTGHTRSAAWIERVAQLSIATTRPDALEAYMTSWTQTDFSGVLQVVQVPVHLIVGELDPGASLERMQETIMPWYSDARMEGLAGVGHYPMHESPGELSTLLTGHFARITAPGRPNRSDIADGRRGVVD